MRIERGCTRIYSGVAWLGLLYPLKIIKLYLEQSSSQHKKWMPRNFIGGSITCCKVDIRTTGKDISQLKRKLKYIMGYPRIYVKFFHRWVKER